MVAEWNAFWAMNERAVFTFLLRLTRGNRTEAEDHLQETFLRSWAGFSSGPGELRLQRPWLFTVARRIVIDAVRARRARPTETFVNDLTDVETRRNDIERFVETQAVRSAVRELRPLYRDALYELYYRERTIAEAARVLGIPEGTVKSRAHQGLKLLQRTMASSDTSQRGAAA